GLTMDFIIEKQWKPTPRTDSIFRSFFFLLALTASAIAGGTLPSTGKHNAKVPVLIDTDIGDGIDDALALALALARPELEVRGITTVHGDAHTRALLVCRFLHAIGRDKIPVAAGRPPREKPDSSGQLQYGLRPVRPGQK